VNLNTRNSYIQSHVVLRAALRFQCKKGRGSHGVWGGQVNHVNTGVSHVEIWGKYTRVHCLNSPPTCVATKTDTESAMGRSSQDGRR
jgi:hypothetical protein